MRAYYIAKNYHRTTSARTKASMDSESIMAQAGVLNIGLPTHNYTHSAYSFFYSLASVILGIIRLPRNTILIIQYPLSKYLNLLLKVARFKNCKTILLIHDLDSERTSKLSITYETALLNKSTTLIALNDRMKSFLMDNGVNKPIVSLGIWDYLPNSTSIVSPARIDQNQYTVAYAGGLSERKNAFIYKLQEVYSHNLNFRLYGPGFQKEKLDQGIDRIDYKGAFSPTEITNQINASFGLVWDGDSLETCSGAFGEYLKINNPHKTSMYISAGLPIIIWEQAALASFISEHNIGITIDSVRDLPARLQNLSISDYNKMVGNVAAIQDKISQGYYLETALKKAIIISSAQNK